MKMLLSNLTYFLPLYVNLRVIVLSFGSMDYSDIIELTKY